MKEHGAFQFVLPTRVLFGDNTLEQLGAGLGPAVRKALLVSGRSSMRAQGVTTRILQQLGGRAIETVVFDQVDSNPTDAVVDEAAMICRNAGCDVIIGLGGGSAIDVAKAVSVVAKFGRSCWDFVGRNAVPGDPLALVAVPTTAGTGSEVTPVAVVSKPERRRKDAIVSDHIFPRLAIVDPTLTSALPPELTAATGMDALAHAIEAYTARGSTPLSDMLALEAVRLVGQHLRKAVWQGDDAEARRGMALASMLAGMAIAQAGVGAAHGLGMSIGGFFGSHHGLTVGILLPAVMEHGLGAVPDRYARIAEALGEPVQSVSVRRAASHAPHAVRELMQDIGITATLRQLGVQEESLSDLVADAWDRPDMTNDPRPFTRDEAIAFCRALL